MNDAALWYLGLFLLACFAIMALALLQPFYRHRRIVELTKALRLREESLAASQSQIQQLELTVNQQQEENKANDVDPVTQLMSWRIFSHRFEDHIKEARRYGLTMALLLVNVSETTIIANALGYDIGNQLLKEAADRLAMSIRDVDSITRFGDNAFALLLSQIAKPETAVIVVQRILQAFKRPFIIQDHELYVTASIGIATYPNDAKSSDDLLNCAQHALALARRSGQSNYHFYEESMHRHSQQELILQTNMSRGIFNHDFKVYYQPIIDAEENCLAILDAMPFWYRPMVGTMNASELFSYAEKYQKIDALFTWLLNNACQDFIALHNDRNINQSLSALFHTELPQKMQLHPDLVAIPIALKQLTSHAIYNISQTLLKFGFDPQHLLLEINCGAESISFDVLEKTFNMLDYLKIKIAITHFGQASLSLAYLRKVKPTYIKLDPLMISDLTVNQRTQKLFKAIIFLAHTMNTQLIATGVEYQAQYDLLRSLGVRLMEGPLIGLPMAQIEMINASKAISTD